MAKRIALSTRLLAVFITSLAFVVSQSAFAANASPQCQQSVTQTVNDCNKTLQDTKDALAAAANVAGVTAKGQGIPNPGLALSHQGQNNSYVLLKAAKQCDQLKKQGCDAICLGPNDQEAKRQCDAQITSIENKQVLPAAASGVMAQEGGLNTAAAAQAGAGQGTGSAPAAVARSGGSGGGLSSMLGPLMAAGMMAAMMANQQNQQQQTPMPSPSGYGDITGTIGDNGQPNCGTSSAYGFSACNQQLSAACSANITTQLTSPICAQFSARYCNLGGYQPVPVGSSVPGCPYPYVAGEVCGSKYFTTPSPTAATAVNITGEGVGTTYCLRALQINFCANAANAQCPSCLQLSSLRGPACASNPSLCNVMSSPTIIQQQLANCPSSDPLLSVPGALPSTASTLATGQTAGVVGTATGAAPSILPTVTLPPGATTQPGVILRGLASVGGSRTEVSPEFGPNLFMTASAPIAQRCNAGKLLHCFR